MIPLKNKKGKDNFDWAVQESIGSVSKLQVNLFKAKCRRYMLCYMLAYLFDGNQTEESEPSVTYESIEKFQRNFKCHRNIADTDPAFIAKV